MNKALPEGLPWFMLSLVHLKTSPEFAAPQVVRGFAEAVPAAQLLHRHAGFPLTQEADDPFFVKTLLHVQSPSDGGLDAKPTCSSEPWGRRRSSSGSDSIRGGP